MPIVVLEWDIAFVVVASSVEVQQVASCRMASEARRHSQAGEGVGHRRQGVVEAASQTWMLAVVVVEAWQKPKLQPH